MDIQSKILRVPWCFGESSWSILICSSECFGVDPMDIEDASREHVLGGRGDVYGVSKGVS